MRTARLALLLLIFGFSASAVFARGFDEGIEYTKLAAPQPTQHADKIEVEEFFWYGCPHCYQFEPLLHAWVSKQAKDVEFIRMPAVGNPAWELHARAFYTAELLGVLDKIHQPLFDAFHKFGLRFADEKSLEDFFAEHGVKRADFRDMFHSFAVDARISRARDMGARYGVDSVPTIIINGKYRTSASQAGSHENVLAVMDYLVAKERAAMKKRH